MYSNNFYDLHYILNNLEKRVKSFNEDVSQLDYDIYKFNNYRNRKMNDYKENTIILNQNIQKLEKSIRKLENKKYNDILKYLNE